MNQNTIKNKIEEAIKNFDVNDLTTSAINLFRTLGYNTDRQAPLAQKKFIEFKEDYIDPEKNFNKEKALCGEWTYVDLLFQLSKEEISKQNSLFDTKQVDNTVIETYLFFSIELSNKSYTRTALSNITREVNKLFPMPVMILFKYGNALTLSVINRRLHKRDATRDVLEKVTQIKDINIENPHRAHVEILFDLSFDELQRKHAFTNFVELHNAWQKTLDIQELNKRFFKELANWYFWAMDKVQFPDDMEKKKDIRNATNLIRLITRVIFIWFIKEKNLVPDSLFNKDFVAKILKYFNKNKHSHNYYNAILQNLFFGTLNKKMEERKFAKEGDFKTNKEEYGVKNLFRYADLFTISEKEVLAWFKDIPFLNGGLFDCLDKPNDEGKIVYVDGFSRNSKKKAIVPDYIFFSEEQEIDLTEYYDPKAKKRIIKKVKGLIVILNHFKFTVAENTPIEEEIALDPELLGKVFENLLASYNPETQTTARKQTGSFYTPREIVNYMVDESLIEYLKQNTKIKTDDFDTRLRSLFAYNDEDNPFNPKETDQLIEAINNAKILDPACGSGAFPMGVLHKMVHLLQKLDPGNVKWKAQQKEKIIGKHIQELEKDKKAIAGLSDEAVREKAIQAVDERLKEIDEIFESKNNFDDYARKLYLIENCIYGIDIQPIAVQISKLRFFISLIIDQDKDIKKENLGFRSLPNLETKFVAANTLISLEIPTTDLFSENNPIKLLQEQLKAKRHEYFNAKTRKDKLRLQKQDKELRKKISAQISDTLINQKEDEIKNLEKQLAEAKKKLVQIKTGPEQKETIENTNIFGETKTTVIDKKKEKIKAQKSTISWIEKQLYSLKDADSKDTIEKVGQQISSFDPYDQNHFANWFEPEWMFGLNEGFDVVLGNPPFIAGKSGVFNTQEKKYFNDKYESAEYQLDTYILFTEKGVKLGTDYGLTSFILPNTWLANLKLTKIRKYLLDNTTLLNIVINPNDVFETAVVDTIILITSKIKNPNSKLKLGCFYDWQYKQTNQLEQKSFYQNEKYIFDIKLNKKSRIVVNKIAEGCLRINEICDVNRGVHAYRKDGFGKSKFVDGYQTARDYNEQSYHSNTRIDKTYFKEVRGKNIFPYYFEYSNRWISWGDWLAESRNWKFFSGERIYLRKIVGKTLFAAYVNDENVADQSVYIAKVKNNEYDTKYLLALLNSKLITWFFRVKANEFDDLFPQIKVTEFKELPIKNSNEQSKFKKIIEYIIHYKNLKKDSTFFERLIDALVYELYFPEEIKSAGAEVIKHLNNLPELTDDDEKNLKTIETVYKELSDPKHPVSLAMFKMDTIEEIRIIEGKQ